MAHSPADRIVFVADERVLFVVDLIEGRRFPIVPPFRPMMEAKETHVGRWQATLADVDALKPKVIVHGSLGGTEIVRELRPPVRAQYATWDVPSFIESALRYFARQPLGTNHRSLRFRRHRWTRSRERR